MSARKVWIQIKGLAHFLQRAIILARMIKDPAGIDVSDQGERLMLLGLADLGKRIGHPAHPSQLERIPLMGCRVVGIKLEGSSKFTFAARPVPLVLVFDIGASGVSFGEVPVYFERPGCRRLSFGD